MKKLNFYEMEQLHANGCDAFDCGLTIAGLGLTLAAGAPTGFGGGLLLLGAVSVGMASVARSCNCKGNKH